VSITPDIHIHAFSPEEILYGASRSEVSVEDYLLMLKDAGVGSLPGTAAEILDQKMRDLISPGRISVNDWIRVVRLAHSLDIPTTCTIMYGR
jgi:5-amino-6-(D-ribitylamino)uracil---L-tyrosine 4-hydroxyphenyl transferase